jgi:ribosomal protein S18 acetylase RimI-like enzyme
MSLYGLYIQEREGFGIVENETSFATYRIHGQECYIRDIFVHPDHRHAKAATTLANQINEIAKQAGCKFLTGSVSPNDPNADKNIKVLHGYGFRFAKATPDLLWFITEVV